MAEKIKFDDRLFLTGDKVLFEGRSENPIIESKNGVLVIGNDRDAYDGFEKDADGNYTTTATSTAPHKVVIKGDLEVQGDSTLVYTNQTAFADPFILLNGDHTGPASEDVGIEINRGDDDNQKFGWDETNGRFTTFGANLDVADLNSINIDVANDVNVSGMIYGALTSSDVTITGGNIDNTVIGATTPVQGTFTNLSANDTTVDGDLTVTGVFQTITTDGLTEGTTNLYYTDERVDDRLAAMIDTAYGLSSTYDDAAGSFTMDFDARNIGTGQEILDTSDSIQASFRTLSSGPHLDLTVTTDGDNLVIDTVNKINILEFETFTGTGTQKVYNLSFTVDQPWHLLVYIDGVIQEPTNSYTVSGSTLTLAENLPQALVMNIIKMASNNSFTSTNNAQTLGGNAPSFYLDYGNLQNKPTIPSNVSELNNDSNFITSLPSNVMYNDTHQEIAGDFKPSQDVTYDLGGINRQWKVIHGETVEATYADLAENYTTGEEELPTGTVVAVGKDDCCEVIPAKFSDICVGVVSTNPAYLMNSKSDGQAIALKGRVPVRVSGAVKKGQAVYAWEDGVCGTIQTIALVGIALESNDNEDEKLVECILKV